jgi:hypothetical protein
MRGSVRNSVADLARRTSGGIIMQVTQSEAAKIYAKACKAWYGPRARKVVLNRVQEMRTRGDQSGVKAWEQVAQELEFDKSARDRAV